MLHSSALQVKSSKKELFLKLSKLTKVYKNTIFHVTNHEEKEFLNENFLKDANFFVLPNIPVKLKQVVRNLQKNKEELILSFVGRIAAEKNALFALKVLEASKNKQIELNFYGVMPNTNYAVKFKDKLMEMQQRGFAVNYKGLLHKKELSRVFAKKTHFLFSPTKGENFGHAIIESLSNAVPVVISNKTPWKNIEVEKAGFVLENKIEAQIQILNLLFEMGNECYQLYSENSVKYVQENPLLNNLEEQYLQQVSTILTLTQNE
jgi:glycosyltransferase involved in cell wall biosynthesis